MFILNHFGSKEQLLGHIICSGYERQLPAESGRGTESAIGLKLFSEVMLKHCEHPLFAELRPTFRAFMKQIKEGPALGAFAA